MKNVYINGELISGTIDRIKELFDNIPGDKDWNQGIANQIKQDNSVLLCNGNGKWSLRVETLDDELWDLYIYKTDKKTLLKTMVFICES